MTTRRQLITSGIAATLIGNIGTKDSHAGADASQDDQRTVDLHQIPKSILIVRPGDESFSSSLEQYFPALASNRRFQRFINASLLIINTDSQAIYGIALRWANTKASPMDEYRRFYFYKPTIQLKSRQMSAQRPLVHSNEAVLLTPMFSWSSDVFHSNRWMQKFTAKRLRKYAHAYPRGYGFSVRNGAADQIYVSVEAVAFQNIVVGVRKKKFARVLRNRRNAEHDQAVAIYRSAQSSSDPGSADALIRNVFVGTRSQTEVKDSRVRAYFSARHRFAERMSHLANVSPPRARFVLNLVRSASRSTIR